MNQQPTPYTTYIYLTRVDLLGNPQKYSLHVMLWMPRNYTLIYSDNEPPLGIDVPEIFHHRLVLKDEKPDADDDLLDCRPIVLLVEDFERQERKDIIEVHYIVSNQTRNKIPKKPKAKGAYIHADNGGASPQPPNVSAS
jgi:hypothetical protein